MSWHLLKATLYQRRTALLWYSISLISYSVMIVWYYPIIAKTDLKGMLDAFPPEMIKFFAGSDVSLFTFGGFLATEYTGFIWVLIMAAAGITFATKSYSSEISAGTMELLLAQPISRQALAVTRSVALTIYLGVLVLATVVPIQITAIAMDIKYSVSHLWLFAGVGLLMSLAISGVGMLAAAASRESGKPAGIVGGLLGAMWVLNFLAGSAKWAEALEPVNLFKYWDSAVILDKGIVAASTWWVLGGVALATLVGSVIVFSRRDVA
ncbi:MAG: ABC transporter permease subunit [Actinomycetota bacterium]|nr:ABC transporter permease subunit [Actinomycetota bacterium]